MTGKSIASTHIYKYYDIRAPNPLRVNDHKPFKLKTGNAYSIPTE
jgi:hypothetical protein